MRVIKIEERKHRWQITTVTRVLFLVPVTTTWVGTYDWARGTTRWFKMLPNREVPTNKVINEYLTQCLRDFIDGKLVLDKVQG